ncbi:hypothetical protein V6N12_017480 [Hibiscus sabdariffa]|uniref:Uncharacterized protein n=1 Tax=Hibiscus sabdariffa TaxID=183260 RepID=A0ABR2CFL6_9ROSI
MKLRSLFWIKAVKDDWDFNMEDGWVNPISILGSKRGSVDLVGLWCPPSSRCLKFNVSGVYRKNKAGCGGILRNEPEDIGDDGLFWSMVCFSTSWGCYLKAIDYNMISRGCS